MDNLDKMTEEQHEKELDEIRDRIFLLLESQPISQKDFAEIIDVSAQTITDWKKGKSRSYMQKLPMIAYALRSTTEWIFLGTGHQSQLDETRDIAREHVVALTEEMWGKELADISLAGEINKAELATLLAYRKASEDDRAVVDAALRKYKNESIR